MESVACHLSVAPGRPAGHPLSCKKRELSLKRVKSIIYKKWWIWRKYCLLWSEKKCEINKMQPFYTFPPKYWRQPRHQKSTTPCVKEYFDHTKNECLGCGCLVRWMSGVVDVWCGENLVWWMFGMVYVWCSPFSTHCVADACDIYLHEPK